MSAIKIGRHPLLEMTYELMIRQQSDVDHRLFKDTEREIIEVNAEVIANIRMAARYE